LSQVEVSDMKSVAVPVAAKKSIKNAKIQVWVKSKDEGTSYL